MKITYLTPEKAAIRDLTTAVRQSLSQQGVASDQMVDVAIANLRKNADKHTAIGIDAWLGYGGALPALERVVAAANGESDDDFYRRTQYPKHVVDAYTIAGDDLATLVFCEQYWMAHRRLVPPGTSVWPLNKDEDSFIDLNEFEARLKGIPS